MKQATSTPIAVKTLISMLLEELVDEPLARAEKVKLCKDMVRFGSLRTLIPAAMVLPNREGLQVDKLTTILTDLLPMPKSKLEHHVYRQAFHTLKM